MGLFARLISKFGHFIIFLGFFFLGILIFLGRFAFAEVFANYFLLLLTLIVFLQMLKLKGYVPDQRRFFSKLNLWAGLAIIITVVFVFRPFFLPGPVVWGDAPYFYPEAFKVLTFEPLVWESRGRLGVVNDLYWIYPLMLVYRVFSEFLGLGNDAIIRLLFYFPAVFFSVLSPWLLCRYFRFSQTVCIFSSFVYVLNTYFILVLDGGQVGVALAYALFPFALLQLNKLVAQRTILQFLKSLISFMLLVVADVRFAAIAVFTFILFVVFGHIASLYKINSQHFKTFVIFVFVVLALSSYWLVPSLSLEPTTNLGAGPGLQLVSALHPLFLFSPHWPLNEFGRVSPPTAIFMGIPLLIFSNFLFKKDHRVLFFTFCFLLFVFLAKGSSGLFSNIYAWGVDTVPFGGAFRDSTKFFAPLLIFSGILIGLSVQNLQAFFKENHVLSKIAVGLVFFYLIFLVAPAILGNMRGVLSGRGFPQDIKIIADKFSGKSGFFRTLWFPERHPLAFHTEEKVALDAKELINLRPFASLNVGTFDRFNFLHNESYVDLLKFFGIKYLVFSGEQRKTLTMEEKKDWNNLLQLVSTSPAVVRKDWGINFPVYEVEQPYSRIFTTDKLLVVIGPDDIYDKIGGKPAVFVEDGKFNIKNLEDISGDAAVLIFNKKTKEDLAMSLLQQYFVSPLSSNENEWATYRANDYLTWKYQLLIRGTKTSEFDYNQGIFFSTVKGETVRFNFSVPQSGEYIFAARKMSKSGNFKWIVEKELFLNEGRWDKEFVNETGAEVLNTTALIPKNEWVKAHRLASEITDRFQIIKLDEIGGLGNVMDIPFEMANPVLYKVNPKTPVNWVIFTDSWNPLWFARSGQKLTYPLPIYSVVNGFYVADWDSFEIVFGGQENVRWGIYISTVSILLLAVIFFWNYSKRND